MNNVHVKALLIQMPAQLIRGVNRSMFTTSTADSDGNVALSFAMVKWNQVIEEAAKSLNCFSNFSVLLKEADHRLVIAGEFLQFRDKVWIGEEAHIEHDVGIDRNTVFVAKAHYSDFW